MDIVDRMKDDALSIRRFGEERHGFIDYGLMSANANEAAAEIARLRAEIERLREILKDCADDLEATVEHHYARTKDYPGEMRRYERDIEPVRKARAALATDGKGGG